MKALLRRAIAQITVLSLVTLSAVAQHSREASFKAGSSSPISWGAVPQRPAASSTTW